MELVALSPVEKQRTYVFPDGQSLVFTEVTHFAARPSGTHRLKTGDGKLHIIAAGWRHIEIVAEKFTL